MRRLTLLTLIAATVGGLIATAPASAHIWPPNCNANSLDLTISKSAQVVRNGDVITYGLAAENRKPVPCDITNASVDLWLPTAAGSYDTRQAPVRISSGQNYLAGFAFSPIGSRSWNVALNPGVDNAVVLAQASGVLHDLPQDTNFADIRKTLGTQITSPSITIDKIGSIEAGVGPQNVTYTYFVTNTSTTPVPMNRVGVSDDICVNPTYASGDNGDGLLSNTETWTFTCSMLHQAPGVYTNTAKACAYSTVPGDTTREVCSPPDTWKVTLTTTPPAPPAAPAPQVAVKPVAAAQAPCTLSTPSGLRVRAGQLNTIRATVRNVDAGTTVTITLPGGKKVTAKTNSSGVATLRVRPTKSGRATIRIAQCSEVKRLTVNPARRVVAQQNPRVTG